MLNRQGPGTVRIPATVYPGMFKGEVQVTIRLQDQEISLIVSEDNVEYPEARLTNDGVQGTLIAEIVSRTNEGFLIHLPGDVQGASNRVEYAVS